MQGESPRASLNCSAELDCIMGKLDSLSQYIGMVVRSNVLGVDDDELTLMEKDVELIRRACSTLREVQSKALT